MISTFLSGFLLAAGMAAFYLTLLTIIAIISIIVNGIADRKSVV